MHPGEQRESNLGRNAVQPTLDEGTGAFDIIGDVEWTNLDDLRKYDLNRGIYAGFGVKWHGQTPGGYFGPQAKSKSDPSAENVIFSLWDHKRSGDEGWHPALPRSSSCQRNCNDCRDDETTGTQCKAHIPAYTGQTVRLRIRQTAVDVTESFAGQEWVGDEWTVSIQDLGTGEEWEVGRQLLVAASGMGLKKFQYFHEHIGCTPCGGFDLTERRRGPWVLQPPAVNLVSVSSEYLCAECTCKDHNVSAVYGEPTVTFTTGPSVNSQSDWQRFDLFRCDARPIDCSSIPSESTDIIV